MRRGTGGVNLLRMYGIISFFVMDILRGQLSRHWPGFMARYPLSSLGRKHRLILHHAPGQVVRDSAYCSYSVGRLNMKVWPRISVLFFRAFPGNLRAIFCHFFWVALQFSLKDTAELIKNILSLLLAAYRIIYTILLHSWLLILPRSLNVTEFLAKPISTSVQWVTVISHRMVTKSPD